MHLKLICEMTEYKIKMKLQETETTDIDMGSLPRRITQ